MSSVHVPQKTRTKEEVVSEFRRDQILAAAHEVFATRGFSEATVGEIAAHAGIAKGTIYLYFQSKDEIYRAALHRGLDELQARTRAALAAADGVYAIIRAFVEIKARYFEENREFFQIYLAEFGNVTPHHAPAQKAFQERYLEQVGLLDTLLRDASARGAVRPAVLNGIGFSIFAVAHSLISRRLRGWSAASIDEDVDAAVELLWKGLAGNTHA